MNAAPAALAIDPFPARALADLLDRPGKTGEGDALPLPWRWLYFLDAPARAATGADGHPLRGGFLPPVPLPLRMWAAGRLQVQAPLLIGRTAQKVSTICSIDLKEGKTGPLVFVMVDHQESQGGHTCIAEEQNIVYRDAPTTFAPLPSGESAPAAPVWFVRCCSIRRCSSGFRPSLTTATASISTVTAPHRSSSTPRSWCTTLCWPRRCWTWCSASNPVQRSRDFHFAKYVRPLKARRCAPAVHPQLAVPNSGRATPKDLPA